MRRNKANGRKLSSSLYTIQVSQRDITKKKTGEKVLCIPFSFLISSQWKQFVPPSCQLSETVKQPKAEGCLSSQHHTAASFLQSGPVSLSALADPKRQGRCPESWGFPREGQILPLCSKGESAPSQPSTSCTEAEFQGWFSLSQKTLWNLRPVGSMSS